MTLIGKMQEMSAVILWRIPPGILICEGTFKETVSKQ